MKKKSFQIEEHEYFLEFQFTKNICDIQDLVMTTKPKNSQFEDIVFPPLYKYLWQIN